MEEFPELDLYIFCKDEIVKDLEFINVSLIPKSQEEFYPVMDSFNHYRLSYNGQTHPILKLLDESNIPTKKLKPLGESPQNRKCVITSKATPPFKSLSADQTAAAYNKAKNAGYEVTVDTPVENVAWVIGCESESLYKGAICGSKVTVIPTNESCDLFKRLFPTGEIFKT